MDRVEAGTPLVVVEVLSAVQELRREFPRAIVADLKTMDGSYLETEMMAQAGATHVVVMARAHTATIKMAFKAGGDFAIQAMGKELRCAERVTAAGFRSKTE